jgi:hypothetical protein
MKRRGRIALRVLIGGALMLALVYVVTFAMERYRRPAPASRETLERIAAKNRNAATVAATSQRDQAAAATQAFNAATSANEEEAGNRH